MRSPLSLKAQALALLARREHSRAELETKLLAHARRLAAARAEAAASAARAGAAPAVPSHAPDDTDLAASQAAEVAAVLDGLVAQGWQSDARFVEARVHSRAPRLGLRRIAQELSRHGVELDEETSAALKGSELSRARQVWQRRYGECAPTNLKERARQARFLASRGFSADVVRRVLGGDVPFEDEPS